VLEAREGELSGAAAIGRMYYLALPPSVYAPVVKGLKEHADMQASNPK
jgi:glucose-6-phosphate 1-dehydrogenase